MLGYECVRRISVGKVRGKSFVKLMVAVVKSALMYWGRSVGKLYTSISGLIA